MALLSGRMKVHAQVKGQMANVGCRGGVPTGVGLMAFWRR